VQPNPHLAHDRVRRIVRRRRFFRRARLGSLIVGVLVVISTASYGIVRGILFAEHLWDEHHRAVAAAATTAPTATTTTTPGPPPCATGQVAAYLSHWEITEGTLYEIIVVDGSAGTTCSLTGYASLSVADVDGGNLAVAVHDDPTLGAAAGASTTPVSLGPGQPAWFEVSYPVECTTILTSAQAATGAPGQCYEGESLGVIVPKATTALSVSQPLRFTFGTAGFDIGAFGTGSPPNPPPVSG